MDFTKTWLQTVYHVIHEGALSLPRGKLTRELLHHTIIVDQRRPVLCVPQRSLSYRFMAAEAYWILTGDDRVATIAPYNSRIAEFSDDGERFFGAYGPKIQAQLPYVVSKLLLDPDTRQAGLTIWRESPPATRDVPCTIAIFFNLRGDKLNLHVFMRSSDVWLGVPYDVFNFSMLGHLVCGMLNRARKPQVIPGKLFLTAASSHLYESNWSDARACLGDLVLLGTPKPQPGTPPELFSGEGDLAQALKELRDAPAGDPRRWWETT
jgi:thymidylate synthase